MPNRSPVNKARRQEILDWLKANIQLPPQEALDQARKRWPELRLQRIHALRHVLKTQGVKVPKAKPGGIQPRSAKIKLAIAETQAPAPPAAPLARRKRAEAVVLPMGALSTEEADFMGMVLGLGYNRAARLLAQFRVQFFESLKQHTQDND
jgi:hypothetical protein